MSDSTATSTTALLPDGLRDVRYGEVLLVRRTDAGTYSAAIYNSLGLDDCPPAAWAELDPATIAAENDALVAVLNGPRRWLLDEIVSLVPPATRSFARFGTIEMSLVATLELGPTLPVGERYVHRSVARRTIFRSERERTGRCSAGPLPARAASPLGSGWRRGQPPSGLPPGSTTNPRGLQEHERTGRCSAGPLPARAASPPGSGWRRGQPPSGLPPGSTTNPRGLLRSGRQVLRLHDPDGATYVMQAYCLSVDPDQTLATLASLDERLALPDGWSFSTATLERDLDMLSTDGIATVVQDELENTYQRLDAVTLDAS